MKTTQEPAQKVLPLSLAALGVVFGDIGTSPLYALQATLSGLHDSHNNILGVLSLIFWALIIVISIKYIRYILKADNDGEGGVLALLALLKRHNGKAYGLFFLVGVLGAGLLLGDGMITPAISVLSAIEGLELASPHFVDFVIPLTLIILLALFVSQYLGTARIGRFFGPVLLLWFLILGLLGLRSIIENPVVIVAINPFYAIKFFIDHGWTAYALLGGVFLVVTGGEALYADLGHFGREPIRLACFYVVLPGLLLNYFGQGAYLLMKPAAIANPFYSIAPSWFLYPLIITATLATIIASQAVISATFSLARQAILLDFYPRLRVIQTSKRERGQIYVPQMNAILAVGSVFLVLAFKNSNALTHAYGIAVNLVMLTVTIMVSYVAYAYWKWPIKKVVAIFSIFIFIDAAFLGSNLQKVDTGGWVPLLFAIVCAAVMVTWHRGINFLRAAYYRMDNKGLSERLAECVQNKPVLANTTSIFVSDPYDKGGSGFLHYLKLNNFIPEHALVINVTIDDHPYVSYDERYELKTLGFGMYSLVLHYGFMQSIDIPDALSDAGNAGMFAFPLDVDQVTFLVEITHITVMRNDNNVLNFWQEKLFAFLMRNASLDIEFFKLPHERTLAIGAYCEI